MNREPREAFVLGAGFSRAVSDHMPLTDDLGRLLAAEDEAVFGELRGGSFETWLSHRAEPQPYLSAAQNLERQAVFARATSLIAEALDEAIARTVSEQLPAWLAELVSVWHLRSTEVLTFNYDTLVECAFSTVGLWDWRSGSCFAWGSLLNYNPAGPAGRSFGELDGDVGPVDSLRLWKLHGSTNWFWVPGDASGASARRIELPGRFGTTAAVDADQYRWMAPGRERLLVPPSALKSPYYANPVTRQTWSSGFRALCRADVITLIGYSLPTSDLTTAGMFAEALRRGGASLVRVVDPEPGPVADRIRALAPEGVEVVCVDGHEPAATYARTLVQDSGARFVESLQSRDDADRSLLVVTWGDFASELGDTLGRTTAVVGCERMSGGREVRLFTGELTTFGGAVAARHGSPTPLSVEELRRALHGAERLSVSLPDGHGPSTIIASRDQHSPVGHGTGDWVQLIPAGVPPIARP